MIELDGENHFWEEGIKHDNTRNLYLYKKEIRVLRFENRWIFQDMEYVLSEIKKQFAKQTTDPIINF